MKLVDYYYLIGEAICLVVFIPLACAVWLMDRIEGRG